MLGHTARRLSRKTLPIRRCQELSNRPKHTFLQRGSALSYAGGTPRHPPHWRPTLTIRRLPIVTPKSSRTRPRKAKCTTSSLALLCLKQELSLACTCVSILAVLLVVNLYEPMEMLGAILHSLTAALGETAKLSGGIPGSCMGACRCRQGPWFTRAVFGACAWGTRLRDCELHVCRSFFETGLRSKM